MGLKQIPVVEHNYVTSSLEVIKASILQQDVGLVHVIRSSLFFPLLQLVISDLGVFSP